MARSRYVVGALLGIALYILSKLQLMLYPENFEFKYKIYGFNRSASKAAETIVLIPVRNPRRLFHW